jgi:hypothetical protein
MKVVVKEEIVFVECILKKNKNNFIATVVEIGKNSKTVVFNRTCGSLEGIEGAKKFTTVALELLGQESFMEFIKRGYKKVGIDLILTFKVDKFVRSYVKGFLTFAQENLEMLFKLEITWTHNGVRSRKLRRV